MAPSFRDWVVSIHDAEELSHEVGKMIYSAVRSLHIRTASAAADR